MTGMSSAIYYIQLQLHWPPPQLYQSALCHFLSAGLERLSPLFMRSQRVPPMSIVPVTTSTLVFSTPSLRLVPIFVCQDLSPISFDIVQPQTCDLILSHLGLSLVTLELTLSSWVNSHHLKTCLKSALSIMHRLIASCIQIMFDCNWRIRVWQSWLHHSLGVVLEALF